MLPVFIQYLFRGLGVSGKSGLDLLSYLAFDSAYTSKLRPLGYADAMAQAGALVDFIAPEGLGCPSADRPATRDSARLG